MNKQDQPSTYIVLETIGGGTYSTVKRGIDENKNSVAIKQYHPDKVDLDQIYDEITVLKSLDHPNIVKVIDWKKWEKEICSALITEYFSGGNLYQIIDLSGQLSQKVARTFFLQIIKALKYIHGAGFVHLDIKPQNIMLSDKYELKIVDFGLSCLKKGQNDSGFFTTPAGLTGFQSPEMIKGKYEGTKADIFAAGVTLFFMYTLDFPFLEATKKDNLYKLIIDKNYDQFWINIQKTNRHVSFSFSFKDLFIRMVKSDPTQRITIPQILSHQWSLDSPMPKQLLLKYFNTRRQCIDTRKKQTKQSQDNMEKEHLFREIGHFSMMRGSDDISNELLVLISQQKSNKRELSRFEQKHKLDIILASDTNPAYTVARLKHLLINLQINLHGAQYQPIDYQTISSDSLLQLSGTLIDNLTTNQIEATFERIVQLEDDQYVELSTVRILMGMDYDGERIVFRLVKVRGSQYAFRRVLGLVKNTFDDVAYNKQ